MRRLKPNLALACVLTAMSAPPAPVRAADYRDDIGFTALAQSLGSTLPKGSDVPVMMVEAAVGGTGTPPLPVWSPVVDAGLAAAPYSGVDFTLRDGTSGRSSAISGHAAGVAALFFGDGAMGNGISAVEAALADDWLQTGFLHVEAIDNPATIASTRARVINHSWVGRFTTDNGGPAPAFDAAALRRTDWLIHRDSLVNVVAMNNGDVNQPLLGSSFNSIAVGLTGGNSAQGSLSLATVDAAYGASRTRPDVVVPVGVTSAAAPIVSSLSALLIEVGHKGATNLSRDSTQNRAGDVIYNAERAETIKAALMAGADRVTGNQAASAQIIGYGTAGFATANGLDRRYGAGQVNAVNSYNIIAAGERDPGPLGCQQAVLLCAGFDFNGRFTGTPAEYTFTADDVHNQLSASLVWDLDVGGLVAGGAATLYPLGLSLFDTTTGTVVASSDSTIDNTQNLWLRLLSGHGYAMRVFSLQPGNIDWQYALAWNLTAAPVPLPASLWLMLAALGTMAGTRGSGHRRQVS